LTIYGNCNTYITKSPPYASLRCFTGGNSNIEGTIGFLPGRPAEPRRPKPERKRPEPGSNRRKFELHCHIRCFTGTKSSIEGTIGFLPGRPAELRRSKPGRKGPETGSNRRKFELHCHIRCFTGTKSSIEGTIGFLPGRPADNDLPFAQVFVCREVENNVREHIQLFVFKPLLFLI